MLASHGRASRLLLAAALLAFLVPGAEAATGLSFLKVGPGARAVALGDAVVSNVDDPSANFWNPGALAFRVGGSAEVAHNESFRDVRYEFAGFSARHGKHGFGAAMHGVWSDGLVRTDETGRDIGSFGYYGVSMVGTYALALTERLGAGVGIEYIREQIDTFATSGVAFGFGAQFRDFMTRTDAGFSVQHLGSGLKYEGESFDLPLALQGGLTHHVPLSVADGQLNISAEVRRVRGEDAQLLVGTEYSYRGLASLDVGYRSQLDTQDLSLGAGVGGDRLHAHYAFVPFGEGLGEQHRVSLRLDW